MILWSINIISSTEKQFHPGRDNRFDHSAETNYKNDAALISFRKNVIIFGVRNKNSENIKNKKNSFSVFSKRSTLKVEDIQGDAAHILQINNFLVFIKSCSYHLFVKKD